VPVREGILLFIISFFLYMCDDAGGTLFLPHTRIEANMARAAWTFGLPGYKYTPLAESCRINPWKRTIEDILFGNRQGFENYFIHARAQIMRL
jgi:hypothetical protein